MQWAHKFLVKDKIKTIAGKKIDNIIEHIEDHLTLEVNDLIMNEDNIFDRKINRKLKCKPEDN